MSSPAQADTAIKPKDFVETADGLVFAVVDYPPPGTTRVPCFLRYRRDAGGHWHKLDTAAAEKLLRDTAAGYRHHFDHLDATLHGVLETDIVRHHCTRARAARLLVRPPGDEVERAALNALEILAQAGLASADFGVTGSLLLDAQRSDSDVDIVVHGRRAFHLARNRVRRLTAAGVLSDLGPGDWQQAHARRNCSLTLAEYRFHERRKHNKFVQCGHKIDLSLVLLAHERAPDSGPYRKLGSYRLSAEVTDDARAFEVPARYRIQHPTVSEILSFTATYVGQAFAGETIEAAGQLERDRFGKLRLIVGSDREARGHFLRLAPPPAD